MAHVQGHRADPLHQPVQRIRFHQQHRLQSRVPEPDEIQTQDGKFDSGTLQGRRPHLHHRAGNPRGQRQLSDGTSPRIHTFTARSAWVTPTSARSCMSYGLPYDSDPGRALAGAITAIMTGHAYEQSAEIAATSALPGLPRRPLRARPPADGEGQRRIHARRHPAAPRGRRNHPAQRGIQLLERTKPAIPGTALANGPQHGYRNAQVTVLAPTGTIAFLMDCDTTGVEPDIALVKYKLLAGGGMLKIVNRGVPDALQRLGYGEGNQGHHRPHRETRHH
jgi:hypothetical protein